LVEHIVGVNGETPALQVVQPHLPLNN